MLKHLIYKVFISILVCFSWTEVNSQINCSFSYQVDSLNAVNFTSMVSGGITPYTFQWNFGNGSSSLNSNPIAQYTTSGVYGVNMTVTDANGQSCTTYDTVYVNFCQAFFFARSIPFSNHVSFTNYSAAPSQGVLFTWDFGDNSPLFYGKHASHTYQASGTYNVNLLLFDSLNNCTSSYSDSVTVILPCFAGFNFSVSSNDPLSIAFASTASNYDEIRYDFGDGASSTMANPMHTYTQAGSYIVSQIVRNTNTNCVNQFKDTINIASASCKSGFSYTLSQKTINISNQAINYASITYDFGDGNRSNSPNPSHTYTQLGVYNVCQFVYGPNCVDSSCVSVSVLNPCKADFIATVSSDTISIINQSQLADTIRYDFGDGTIEYSENPEHVYTTSGSYVVCQYIANRDGCSDIKCDTVLISVPRCSAGFLYQQHGDSILFTSTAVDYNSIQYDFGDGNLSNEIDPVHIYAQSGRYVVTQTVLDVRRGCVDTFTDTIEVTISSSCVASFQVAIDTNLVGTLFILNTSSNDKTHQYRWFFGDGNIDSVRLPSHTYAENKAHQVCLTVYDSSLGCSSTYCDTIGLDSNGNLLKSNGYQLRVLEGDFIGVVEENVVQASIYPNPFNSILHITGLNLESKTEVFVRDLNGRIIWQEILTEESIRLNTLLNGIYLIEIRQNEASIIKKVIKQ